jgi:predicted ATPase
MLDAATRRLAGGLFDFADMGEAALEGFGAPVRAWRALRQRAAGNRFEALRGTAGGGTAPLVGRDEELEMLLRRWRQANGGEGRVVLLSGEPGIGKSRLVAALADALAEDGAPYHRLSWYCSPQHTGSVLHPVAAWLRRAAGFARGDAPGERSAKLEALLAPDDPAPEDVALLAELLGVPAPGRDAAHEPSPQRRRERTLASLLRRVEALSRRRPVLALVEDAHWADPSTRELLDMLVARVEGLPVLLVVTHRPEFQAPWVGQAHVTAAALSRLGRRESAALVARVAGGKALPAALLDHVVGRTDGVPLFVEELTKTVLEGGLLREAADRWELAGPLPPPAVPTTLQASLLARLDRLGPAKEVAQAGAAVGREFSYELLAAVVPRPEADFRGALDRLVEAGLVFRTGEPPRSTYLFKHAMVQEAAYGTLLRARRRELHAGIARALGELSPETAEARPEVLAHHCTQAGLAGDAVDHWGKAGRRAIFRSAMAEASAHLRRALELLPALPDEPATWRRELDLQLALAVATNWTEGQAAPATGQAYARARQLCRQLGETERLAPVLAGLAAHHVNRAEPEAGRAAAEEMLRLAAARGDASAELAARRLVGYALIKLGRPAPARGHLERVLAQCDAARDRAFSADFPVDTRIGALSWLANALFILGFPDQAMARGREALAEARALRHVPSLTVALVAAGCALSGLARDAEATREHAEELEALCARLPAFRNTARLYRGWALSVAEDGGASDEGVGRMQEALDAYRAIGVGTLVPQALGLQADAHRRAGRPERGLGLLDEALAFAERSGERTFEAELHRIRGELLLELSRGDAEPCFHRAIEVARAQEAKMWELRAAVCLARLWQRLGRPAEARDLLSPIHAWFTEGAACPDLVEARALLEELGGADAAAVPVRAGEAGAAAMRR